MSKDQVAEFMQENKDRVVAWVNTELKKPHGIVFVGLIGETYDQELYEYLIENKTIDQKAQVWELSAEDPEHAYMSENVLSVRRLREGFEISIWQLDELLPLGKLRDIGITRMGTRLFLVPAYET